MKAMGSTATDALLLYLQVGLISRTSSEGVEAVADPMPMFNPEVCACDG